MIKIIKGVYGVKRVDSKSAPFTLSKEEEARLVSLGVAEYVDAPETEAPAEADTPAEAEEAVATDVEAPVEETTAEAPVEEVKKATTKKAKKAKK